MDTGNIKTCAHWNQNQMYYGTAQPIRVLKLRTELWSKSIPIDWDCALWDDDINSMLPTLSTGTGSIFSLLYKYLGRYTHSTCCVV